MNNATKTIASVHIALAGLCFIFIVIITLDVNRNFDVALTENPADEKAQANEQLTANIPVASSNAIDEYDHIIERPLFMADRRPYIPEETAVTPQKPHRKGKTRREIQDEFMLSAIIITDNKRIALLQSKKNKKLQKLNQGEDIDGWIVTEIQPTMISLEKGSEIKRLELVIKGSPDQADALRKKDNNQPDLKDANPSAALIEKNDPGSQTAENMNNNPENPAD